MKNVNMRRARRSSRKRPRLLVPVFYPSLELNLVPFARSILGDRKLIVLGVVPVSKERSLSEAAPEARELRTYFRKQITPSGIRAWPKIIVSHRPYLEISDFALEHNVELMLMPWFETVDCFEWLIEPILETFPRDIALVRGEPPQDGGDILAILQPCPDSEVSIRISLDLTKSGNYTLTTLRPTTEQIERDTSQAEVALDQLMAYLPQVERALLEDTILIANNPVDLVLEHAEDYDLIIVGYYGPDGVSNHIPDPLTKVLKEKSQLPIISTHSRQSRVVEPSPEDIGIEAITILVDKWFAESTFHTEEFENLERLLARKVEQGVSISLALPALNEERTVANVIRTIQTALMEQVPLLDEIILVDSNSTDRTRQIAEGQDIPVYIHQEVLPQYGAREGKGEALWKSLYLTRGDILLWIDTDIVNIHPRFVYGLLGPLLQRPDLLLIKGFYLRPIKVGDKIQAGGGGRVTELTARPMLNLFYPALSGVIQPLAGEYGGRRSALEQIPFSSGYGVEVGILIDILELYGLGALGQVDLIQRIHHNQPLTTLSKMSFAIIQTLVRRLDKRYGIHLLEDVNRSMKLVRRLRNQFFLDVEEIVEHERPPMITIPEYNAIFTQPIKGNHGLQ